MRAIAGADQLARLPSVHDVARRAGVSASTVSAVLTGRVPVRAATRAAVLAAARDLGYRPHAAARALRVGRATTVAFAVSEITSVTNAVVLRGAVAAAQQRDYDVSLFDLAGQSDHEDRFVDRLLRAPPQGAIIYTLGGALEAYQRAARRGVALTFIDRRPALEHVDYVSTDGGFGVARVVRHLVSLGRRRIAIIVGPQAQTVFRHRLDGYRDAYEAYGLEYAPELVRICLPSPEEGARCVTSLLAEAHPPDALYAASSLLTMGAFQALRGSGRRVPDDIAFVGTGFIEWAHLTDPPLTLLEVPALEIGRRAVELVLDRVGSPGLPGRSVLIEPTLHIRESCGANPALAPSIKAGSGNAN